MTRRAARRLSSASDGGPPQATCPGPAGSREMVARAPLHALCFSCALLAVGLLVRGARCEALANAASIALRRIPSTCERFQRLVAPAMRRRKKCQSRAAGAAFHWRRRYRSDAAGSGALAMPLAAGNRPPRALERLWAGISRQSARSCGVRSVRTGDRGGRRPPPTCDSARCFVRQPHAWARRAISRAEQRGKIRLGVHRGCNGGGHA